MIRRGFMLAFILAFAVSFTNSVQAEETKAEADIQNENNTQQDPHIVIVGDIKFFLDDQEYITYAEVYKDGNLIKIQVYLPHTKVEDAEGNIMHTYFLNTDQTIKFSQFENKDKHSVQYYEYFPDTVYTVAGKHKNSVKYEFTSDEKGNIVHSVEKAEKNQKVVHIYEYYPNSKYNNGKLDGHIKTVYDINESNYIIKAIILDERTQKANKVYEYYPNTLYGKHEANIQYSFDLNSAGYLTKSAKLEKGTKKVLRRYEYYPNTVYGNHVKNVSYIHDLDGKGNITKGQKREKGTQKILKWYEYYSGTPFDKRTKNVSYIHDLDGKGNIIKGQKREKGTQKVLSWYEYYSNIPFEKRAKNVKFVFYLKGSYLVSASEREKGTARVVKRYTYYDKAVYGKHSKKIKDVTAYDKSGYITSTLVRKNNTSTVTKANEYYPKTTTGNKSNNIKYSFQLNSNGTIKIAYLKEQKTQKTKGYYKFKSGTTFGNHWSKIASMQLYVPKIMQYGQPWGCAIVALTETLNFKGYNLDKDKMAKSIPYSKDPYKGYVGSPFRSQQGDPNLIYPEGLVGTAKKYRSGSEVINGITEAQIKSELQKGNPVLVWVVYKFTPLKWRYYYSGKLYAPSAYHVVALNGYNNGQYLFKDTSGHNLQDTVSYTLFNKIFNSFDRRALVIR